MTTIIIAPHPDDDWIGCGCRILQETDNGCHVKVLIITGRTPWRIDLCKKLGRKHNFEVKCLGEREFNIDAKRLAAFLKKEIKEDDVVFLPCVDGHKDHKFIQGVALAILKRNVVYEVGIYNRSANPVIKAIHKVKEWATGVAHPSFRWGRGQVLDYKTATKVQYVKDLKEMPRGQDLFRRVR